MVASDGQAFFPLQNKHTKKTYIKEENKNNNKKPNNQPNNKKTTTTAQKFRLKCYKQ